MPYPDNFNSREFERVWGSDDDSISDTVANIGLRAEYAEYLEDKKNPAISFEAWCSDIDENFVKEEIAQENQRATKTTMGELLIAVCNAELHN